jgi:hypothetical protein
VTSFLVTLVDCPCCLGRGHSELVPSFLVAPSSGSSLAELPLLFSSDSSYSAPAHQYSFPDYPDAQSPFQFMGFSLAGVGHGLDYIFSKPVWIVLSWPV